MKITKRILTGVLIVLMVGVVGAVLVFRQSERHVEVVCELHQANIGSFYILGQSDGWLAGHTVMFVRRDPQGRWAAYQLAHESPSWHGKSKLVVEQKVVNVYNGSKKAAEYDTQSGVFTFITYGPVGVDFPARDGVVNKQQYDWWEMERLEKRQQ